ncbi:MAG: hypothetical protein RLW62_10770 [Gammaproteobacteria bacterium]
MRQGRGTGPPRIGLLDRIGVAALVVAGAALGLALANVGAPVEAHGWMLFQPALGLAVGAFGSSRCIDIAQILRRPTAPSGSRDDERGRVV